MIVLCDSLSVSSHVVAKWFCHCYEVINVVSGYSIYNLQLL